MRIEDVINRTRTSLCPQQFSYLFVSTVNSWQLVLVWKESPCLTATFLWISACLFVSHYSSVFLDFHFLPLLNRKWLPNVEICVLKFIWVLGAYVLLGHKAHLNILKISSKFQVFDFYMSLVFLKFNIQRCAKISDCDSVKLIHYKMAELAYTIVILNRKR